MEEWNSVDILLAEDNVADAEMTLRAFRKSGLTMKILAVHEHKCWISWLNP